ncbi:MAG: hypothetical protein SWC40_05225 [Thermodesulfobacteriota bacterium]|nr:hypothetical protein [Thermodesulfobacteriota bacterium]
MNPKSDAPMTATEKRPGGRRLSAGVLAICGVALLKALLAFGIFIGDNGEKAEVLSPPEVQAEESAPAAGQAGTTPTGQGAADGKALEPPVVDLTPEMVAYVKEREAALERKEAELREREAYLKKMEKELEQKLKELLSLQEKMKTVQEEIQTYRAQREEESNQQIRSLGKIYSTMKPKEAAKLLENLEEELVVRIITTLPPDQAADILANMDVKKAAKISTALCVANP